MNQKWLFYLSLIILAIVTQTLCYQAFGRVGFLVNFGLLVFYDPLRCCERKSPH